MDIDIDSADREKIIKLIKCIPSVIHKNNDVVKHNTGVHVTDIPYDPATGLCNIDHKSAENLGYIKLDLLNVYIYERIKDNNHLTRLLTTEPDWEKLKSKIFVGNLIHIHGHWNTLKQMPEPVNSIARMAMFLSVIRPAKRHLIGLPWKDVVKSVWEKPVDDGYFFKKSHAIAYATLVAVNMNLDCET
jgi:hypothetical protein